MISEKNIENNTAQVPFQLSVSMILAWVNRLDLRYCRCQKSRPFKLKCNRKVLLSQSVMALVESDPVDPS